VAASAFKDEIAVRAITQMLVGFLAYENLAGLRLAKQGVGGRDRTGVTFEKKAEARWDGGPTGGAETIVGTALAKTL